MENKKNTPPTSIFIAIGIIAALVIFYFILTAIFPGLFSGMSQGKLAPVK